MDKPTKPTNLMPRSFGGVKNNFPTSMQSTGFEDSVPVIYGGDNLNYQLDATGKELDYCEKIVDFINALPIGKTITTDANNKLVYADYGTDITGKANISLDNLNANGKERIGIKGYVVTDTYNEGDVVLAIIDDKVSLFKSLIDNNVGNALSDDTKWEEVKLGGGARNVGEIVSSTLPLTDAGLHLLDGTRLSGDGIYKGFVDYIAELYNDTKVYNPSAFTVVGSPTITDDGIASGFNNNNYLKRVQTFDFNKPFIINAEFVTGEPDNTEQCLFQFGDLNSFTFRIHSDNRFILYYPKNTGPEFIFGSVALSNTKYFLEIEYDLTKLTAKLGLSKDNMQTFAEITNADFSLTQSYRFLVGITLSLNRYWNGSIDLKNFSITVDGVEVFSGSNPANYFTTESAWQASVTQYGSCGKFVYDSVNNTVRLPKITGILEGTTDISALGDLIEAGLPNITGSFRPSDGVDSTSTGCVYDAKSSGYGEGGGTAGQSFGFHQYFIDASRSSSLYKNNFNKVQPQTIKALYYIVIANSTKTEIQSDIDEIATDLNGKADVDLSNINASQSAKNEIISWGLPDLSNAITYANDTTVHTAPSDGYILLSGRATSGSLKFYINGINIGWSWANATYATGMSWFVPVSKGDTFYIDQSYTSNVYRFYPMKGSN